MPLKKAPNFLLSAMNIWSEYEALEKEQVVRIGDLNVWFRREGTEIWLAHDREAEPNSDAQRNWMRWAAPDAGTKLSFRPIMPDKPVIVRPEFPFRILQRAEARIYVRIPVWVEIVLKGKKEQKLLELPTIELSKTWFGNQMGGQLCYWISTKARRELEEGIFVPWLAVCPILIKNKASEELNFEKMCFRVPQSCLFYKEGQLWSDETVVEYKGGSQYSDISMSGKPPKVAGNIPRIANPRNPEKHLLSTLTFDLLKDIQHWF